MVKKAASYEAAQRFRHQITRPFTFRFFLIGRMPIAYLAGLRIEQFDASVCIISIPYWWLSQNPFKSVYFATQAMAAEMSTGLPAMASIQGYRPAISMLVTGLQATFQKKASSRIYFTCTEGAALQEKVANAVQQGLAEVVDVTSEGRLKDGTLISTFTISWSFKQKKK